MFDVTPITSPRRNDCGATCLKMLLAYYKIEVDLETLIKECRVTRKGCTLADINRAGRAHGLDMVSYEDGDSGNSVAWDGATKQDRPCIVWWRKNHFVVCCGLDDDGKVVICDPDVGRYRITQGTFDSYNSNVFAFNGVPDNLKNVTEPKEENSNEEPPVDGQPS